MFQRKRRAFTLIELMLVIAIMAVFSAMAMPRYGRSLARYRADVTARRIAADMALVQTRARAMGATRSMTFSLVEGRYQLTGEVDPTTSTSVYTVDLSQNPYRASIVSASFNGSPTLSFNGFGIPSQGGTVVVQSGSEQRTITLAAVSGQTTIQ